VFYAMKLVRGSRLDEYVARVNSTKDRLRKFQAACDAVAFAHAHGVVHRDLKPENVLVETRGQDPRVFLIDFGIALFGESEQHSSTTTRFFGTTQYMAPEQLLGQPGPASDLYAFALLVYEMAAGKPLFEAATPAALYELQRKLAESDFDLAISGALRSLLWLALRPDPKRRPRDAVGVAGPRRTREILRVHSPTVTAIHRRRADIHPASGSVLAPAQGAGISLRRPYQCVRVHAERRRGQRPHPRMLPRQRRL